MSFSCPIRGVTSVDYGVLTGMFRKSLTPPRPNAFLTGCDTALYGFTDAEFQIVYLLRYFASSVTSIALISA